MESGSLGGHELACTRVGMVKKKWGEVSRGAGRRLGIVIEQGAKQRPRPDDTQRIGSETEGPKEIRPLEPIYLGHTP